MTATERQAARNATTELRQAITALQAEQAACEDDLELYITYGHDAQDLEWVARLLDDHDYQGASDAAARLDTAVRDRIPASVMALPVWREEWRVLA